MEVGLPKKRKKRGFLLQFGLIDDSIGIFRRAGLARVVRWIHRLFCRWGTDVRGLSSWNMSNDYWRLVTQELIM